MEIVDKNKEYYCDTFTKATNFTQLMLCVLNNDLERKCEALRNSPSENALHYLSEKGCGALSEINAKNSLGWTALHIACRNSFRDNSIVMIEFLLNNGADPNLKNNDGWTSLHFAVTYLAKDNRLAIVELLLRNGADPNVKNSFGYTPLDLASKHSPLEVVKFLIENGAVPVNNETKIIKLELENEALRKDVSVLQKEMGDIKNLLKEHFDCAPDGPLYIEAKSRFENKNY